MDYYDDDLEQSLDDVNGLSEGLKETPRKAANQLKKRAARGARKAVSNGTKKAARAVSNGTKKAAKAMGKMAASAVKAGIRAIGGAVKSIIHFLVATPPGWICDIILLLFLIIVGGIYVFQYEERGSNESNNLDPDVQNPAYMDTLTGITRAVAMTEPQAVIDAYYKYMSTSSYVKVSGAETFQFQNPEQTQDFAGLRDYNKIEENFYLSDDFVRMVDEILHQEDFFYPEQVIKPVFGAKMTLKDSAGNEGEYYTARLPVDTADGSIMLDEERVKNFSDMLVDATALASPSATGDSPQLIAQSQVPQAIEGEEGYFSLEERNIVEGDGITSTQPGLWDYGFASVLQYQPAQKISYIECSYDSADVDFDYKVYDEDSGDWLGPYHGGVYSIPITGTLFDFYTACSAKCTELQGESETISYSYKAPTNIAAIVNDTTAWVTSVEGNATEEASYSSFYGRTVTNSHIDAKIVDAWDKDIDNLEFASSALESSYGNVGGGLYPINIAIVSHAATFSGNIHYSVIPAGEDGCIKSSVSLSYNSQADSDMRLPVQNIRVAGGCESATLTAHRTGNLITMLPKVEETTSPWGFEYLQAYAEHYTAYAPKEYIADRDFFVRAGLQADEGNEMREEYQQNLSFLMDLGLLRLYSGNIQLGSVGSVDLSTANDPTSDLYILSHIIAAEAGANKLDELMVGSVFVNRVFSSRYPNTFWEVLVQPSQYSSYPDLYNRATVTDSDLASAIQVLSGQFTIPENVVGQSAYQQGTIYTSVYNGPHAYTHIYCTCNNDTVSTVDRYGRPAPTADQLQGLADALDGKTPAQASASTSSLDYSSTAFLGDSLTVGLNTTQGLSSNGATVVAEESASINHLKELVESSTALNSSIKTVYLMIGINSCTQSDSTFKSQYIDLLSAIDTKTGGAQVILTSLTPVIDGMSNASNSYVNAKNAVISQIAAERGLRILDIHSILVKDGALNPNYSADGLHLQPAGYSAWFSKILSGLTSTTLNDGSSASSAFQLLDNAGMPIYSNFTLYEISNFDVLTATNMQAKITQAETGIVAAVKGFFNDVVDFVTDTVDGFKEFMSKVTEAMSVRIFGTGTERGNSYFEYGVPYATYDIESTVYHTLSFATQTWFSTSESQAQKMAEGDDVMFLFVGKINALAQGTINTATSGRMVPGVGTTVEGMISPTNSYYSPLTTYNSTTGGMEVSVPSSTNILSVADGTITAVNTDSSDSRGKYVTMTATLDGKTYTITYGYLNSISVVAGNSVTQGSLIGTSGTRQDGTAALYLSVSVDGVAVDPASIFYQSTYIYGSGSLGGDLYNSDGTVNAAKIDALEAQLNDFVLNGGYRNSPYYTAPMNTLQYKQCTWWATGRGLEYVLTVAKSATSSQFKNACHGNGGDYYMNNLSAGMFNSGTTPKPNSLVCFQITSPEQVYGHIAYVEAVDYVNQVYYMSEAGSGTYWGGIIKKNFGSAYYSPTYGNYQTGVFIYLDEPLM